MNSDQLNSPTHQDPEWAQIHALAIYQGKLRALLKDGCELADGQTLTALSQAIEAIGNDIETRIGKANFSDQATLSAPTLTPQEKTALMNITPFNAVNKP